MKKETEKQIFFFIIPAVLYFLLSKLANSYQDTTTLLFYSIALGIVAVISGEFEKEKSGSKFLPLISIPFVVTLLFNILNGWTDGVSLFFSPPANVFIVLLSWVFIERFV